MKRYNNFKDFFESKEIPESLEDEALEIYFENTKKELGYMYKKIDFHKIIFKAMDKLDIWIENFPNIRIFNELGYNLPEKL